MSVTSDSTHLKESPTTVQVKVTVSIGHGLSTLTKYWALWKVFNVWKPIIKFFLTSAEASQNASQDNFKELHLSCQLKLDQYRLHCLHIHWQFKLKLLTRQLTVLYYGVILVLKLGWLQNFQWGCVFIQAKPLDWTRSAHALCYCWWSEANWSYTAPRLHVIPPLTQYTTYASKGLSHAALFWSWYTLEVTGSKKELVWL